MAELWRVSPKEAAAKEEQQRAREAEVEEGLRRQGFDLESLKVKQQPSRHLEEIKVCKRTRCQKVWLTL